MNLQCFLNVYLRTMIKLIIMRKRSGKTVWVLCMVEGTAYAGDLTNIWCMK